jgi:hypothetical protein
VRRVAAQPADEAGAERRGAEEANTEERRCGRSKARSREGRHGPRLELTSVRRRRRAPKDAGTGGARVAADKDGADEIEAGADEIEPKTDSADTPRRTRRRSRGRCWCRGRRRRGGAAARRRTRTGAELEQRRRGRAATRRTTRTGAEDGRRWASRTRSRNEEAKDGARLREAEQAGRSRGAGCGRRGRGRRWTEDFYALGYTGCWEPETSIVWAP